METTIEKMPLHELSTQELEKVIAEKFSNSITDAIAEIIVSVVIETIFQMILENDNFLDPKPDTKKAIAHEIFCALNRNEILRAITSRVSKDLISETINRRSSYGKIFAPAAGND